MKLSKALLLCCSPLLALSILFAAPSDGCARISSSHKAYTQIKYGRGHVAQSTRRTARQNRKSDISAQSNRAAKSEREVWRNRARASGNAMLGTASWYGKDWHSLPTASGLPYDMYTFTAAHRTLPLGTVVRVTDQYNGKSVMVCVTDRGPYVGNRIIDMSYAAAGSLGMKEKGLSTVGLEVVSDASGKPLSADEAFFVQVDSPQGKDKFGPYRLFADAAAMHEAVLQAHPEARVILDKTR